MVSVHPQRLVLRQRRDFAGEAEVTEQVGAVRRDFDIENGVVREKFADRGADLRLRQRE